jgi:hypothetical protein
MDAWRAERQEGTRVVLVANPGAIARLMNGRHNENRDKKSPKKRFLIVIGMLFLAVYLFMGLAVIFWKKFPIAMEMQYRVAFGTLLIVYAIFRFYRYIKSENE